MNTMTMSGAHARIVWGYHTAASVSAWSISASGALTATVSSVDTFKLGQHGLSLRVDRQHGHVWEWPIVQLSIAGDTVTGTVSLQE